MAYPLHDKESETVFHKIKKFLAYYGFPEQFGSDNGREFSNKLLTTVFLEIIPPRINPHPQNFRFQI